MRYFCFVFSLLCLMLYCQEGQNLIDNGDFHDYVDGEINCWRFDENARLEYHAEGGPANLPFVSMLPCENPATENKLRVIDMTLVPGETYHMSVWIRTKDLSSNLGALLLINSNWTKSEGFRAFPANTDGWQKFETDVVCPESAEESKYGLVMVIVNQKGALDFADVSLVPLTGAGIAGSKPTNVGRIAHAVRLVPWKPSFNEVPLSSPKISFVWYGAPNDTFKIGEHLLRVCGSGDFATEPIAFKEGEPFEFDLSGLPEGLQKITVQALSKADSSVVYEEEFLVNLRDIPRVEEATKGRRLNNLTVELVNERHDAEVPFCFTLAHDSWMYFTVKEPAQADFTMLLDGSKIDDCITGLPEALRFVSAGQHTFQASCNGRLVARTIAETFSCALLEGPRVTAFPDYDWKFASKWYFPSVTSCNRGAPNAEQMKATRDSGRIWLGNLNAVNPASVAEMEERMNDTLPQNAALFDGTSADEIFYDFPWVDNYTQALKRNGYDRSHLIYTWVTSRPLKRALHTDFIGAALNASHGRGKILREAYIGADTLDEAEARRKVEERIVPYMETSRNYYPDFTRRAGVIFGNFDQLNVITLCHYPEVDYKYYLDMQMNILANNPTFEGLGMVGYWGTHYADEEMYRWSHALLRHYVIEGHREMLSDKYGFSYTPGHMVNNDFADGLSGWTVEAAEQGSVYTASMFGYHDINQDRWGDNYPENLGDTFCVMKRMEGGANRVSQIAKGLVPGKKYMFLFSVGDYDDLLVQRFNPRRFGVDVILEDVDIQEQFVYVDSRTYGNYSRNSNVARQNLHRIIFTPKSSEVKIIITDEKAQPGESHQFNYIQLKPFFPIEE